MRNNRFVFVVPVFNEESGIEQTIRTFIAQSYKDWRAIIINDMSTDKTLNVIESVVNDSKFADRVKVINNTEKMGEVRNTLNAAQMIEADEIVCRVDGGDWLTENDSLHILNEVYKTETVDVVWTSHRWAYTNTNISGPLNLTPGQTVYQHPWVSSHMKTFRKKRIDAVPDANFRDQDGNYITIACDQAVFLPMLHTALRDRRQVGHIPLVCYHYNIDLNDRKLFQSERSIRQKNSAEWIRSRGFIG